MSEAGKACIIGDVVSLSYMLSLAVPEDYREKFREELKSGKKISLLRCEDSFEVVHTENGYIQYYTAEMPYGVELFPHDDKYDWQTDEADFVLFLFPWPFNAKTQLDRIDKVYQYIKNDFKPVHFKAVLYNDKYQRKAYSDLETREESVDRSKEKIMKKLKDLKLSDVKDLSDVIDCVVVNNIEDFELMFSDEDLMITGINSVTYKTVSKLSGIIADFHSYDYDNFKVVKVGSDFELESLNEITAYENVKSTSNLNLTYWNNLRMSRNWTKFCNNIKELYKETLSEFCIWNMEKDADRVINLINQKLQEVLVNPNVKSDFHGIELDYDLNQSVTKVKFNNDLKFFVTQTVPDIIVEELKLKEKLYFPNKYTGK